MATPFQDASVLVTGGTGSFGKHFIQHLLDEHAPRRVVVFSRDELKQSEMAAAFGDRRLRYFIGDVRDQARLRRAFKGVDVVVHAAALKHVPVIEYNPFEAVKTNILGAQNIIEAAIDEGVKRVIALSTDKASSPVNLYGATKLVSDKLFVHGNVYSPEGTRFAVVRYGNVMGSRGSIVPLFRKLAAGGRIPITDERMTRFVITLQQGVQFVVDSLTNMRGGEVFVPRIPSVNITDVARAIAPDAEQHLVGIRPGEKLHEEMISVDEARRTTRHERHFVIHSELERAVNLPSDKLVPDGFRYASDTNDEWLDVEGIRQLLQHV